jgi:hypothetical protein
MKRQEVEARIGQGWSDLAPEFRSGACGAAGTRLIETLRRRVVLLIDEAEQTRRDIDLSDIGRERKLRRLAAAARSDEEIEQARLSWQQALTARETVLESAIAEATTISPPREPFEISLDAEIRAHLRSLDREERYGILDHAARHGDLTTLRAFFSAPAYLSRVSAGEGERIRQRTAGARAAAETRELELLERANELVRAAMLSYDRVVLELTEDPASSWRVEPAQRDALLKELLELDSRSRFQN